MRTAELPALAFCSSCERHTYHMDGACLRCPDKPIDLAPKRWEQAKKASVPPASVNRKRDVHFAAIQGVISRPEAEEIEPPVVRGSWAYAIAASMLIVSAVGLALAMWR